MGALATYSPIVSYSARRALWRKNCSILPKVIRKRRNDSVSLCLSLSLSVFLCLSLPVHNRCEPEPSGGSAERELHSGGLE